MPRDLFKCLTLIFPGMAGARPSPSLVRRPARRFTPTLGGYGLETRLAPASVSVGQAIVTITVTNDPSNSPPSPDPGPGPGDPGSGPILTGPDQGPTNPIA
jgi:hypothetical protein